MEKQKKKIINKAIKRHNKIYPCGIYSSFDECFTRRNGTLFFWYNTEDKSTHIIYQKIKDT